MDSLCISWRDADGEALTFNQFIAKAQRAYVLAVLEASGYRVTYAARLAGRNRTDFYKIMSRNGEYRQTKIGAWDRLIPADLQDPRNADGHTHTHG